MALLTPAPAQAFDNLYYVEERWVSAWAIKTAPGIILIDSARGRAPKPPRTSSTGLRRFGLDPAKIRSIIVTHRHGDHYRGVSHLVEKYHPRVVMSDVDWTQTETRLDFDMAAWGRPPRRDIASRDGDTLVQDDTTVTLYVTPGHTFGALSPVFDKLANGQSNRVMLWGGTSFNFGRNFPRLDAYIASTERMRRISRASCTSTS